MISSRIKKIKSQLFHQKLDGLFVTNALNIYYLTGFRGVSETEREVVVLLTQKNLTLFAPQLYQQEAARLATKNAFQATILEERHFLFTVPPQSFPKNSTIGIESTDLRLTEFDTLKKNSAAKLVKTQGIIEKQRIIKNHSELKLIKKAVKLTDLAFAQIKNQLKPGLTEKDVVSLIKQTMEKLGADDIAFEPIVASGGNSALPHYQPTNTKLKKGIVLIDAGAKYQGYNGDLTRTYYLGKPDQKFTSTYRFLLEVQKKAIAHTLAGKTEQEVWQYANDLLGKEAKYFIHGLGHGIGLSVHEDPYLRKGKHTQLVPGMAITVEPGLYYPNWGGIRIEDFVLVTPDKCQILSKTSPALSDILIP